MCNHERAVAQTTFTLGTTTTASTNAGLVPINTTLEKLKSQYLVRASELAAVGASSGLITALALYVTEQPGRDMNNFHINIGVTTDNSLTYAFVSGLSNVYFANPQLRTQLLAGGWHTFTFHTPFFWDGSSNILIEFCWDNGQSWTFGGGVRVYEPFSSPVYSSRWNVMSAAGGCNYTGNAGQVSWYRPNLQLTITPCTPTTFTMNETACSSYTLNGQTYTAAGTYTQILTNAAGCDSIITLNLSLLNNDTVLYVTTCNSYVFNGNLLVTSGTYHAILTNAHGCDSLVTLHLTIGNNDSVVTVSACDSFVFSGNTLTTSGIYTSTFVNALGCDSVVTLQLTVNNSSINQLNVAACDGYNFNGHLLTTSGTYYAWLTSNAGCDSTVVLHLTIRNYDVTFISDTTCYSYIFHGNTLTTSGRYSVLLTNTAGCDSIVFLDLFIPADSFTISHLACGSFTFNGQELTTSGTYQALFTSSLGCDSMVTLHLTVVHVDTTVTVSGNVLTANESGAAYQWLDCDDGQPLSGATNRSFTATINGNYAVQITRNNCSFFSACYNVTGVGVLKEETNTIIIYPNPVSGRLIIQGDFVNYHLRITEPSGRQIYLPLHHHSNHLEADMSQLPAGVYFIEINGKEKLQRHQLLKYP
jgi:hypothetical protein